MVDKLVFDNSGGFERDAVTRRAAGLLQNDPRCMAFLASADCESIKQLPIGTTIEQPALRYVNSGLQSRASLACPKAATCPLLGPHHHEPRLDPQLNLPPG